jgi:hypothetical protein
MVEVLAASQPVGDVQPSCPGESSRSRTPKRQPARRQPIPDGRGQRHHSHIPTDPVQNAVEYLVRIKDFLACRGVSKAWRAAVSDAVGYLNDKCWTELDGTDADGPLRRRFRLDSDHAGFRCAMLCLRPRLKALKWTEPALRLLKPLFGKGSAALNTLEVDVAA